MADSENVALLTMQLSNLVTSLKQQGILDEFFDVAYKLKDDTCNPHFFLQTTSAFITNAEELLTIINKALMNHIVDFDDIFQHHIALKGSCSSLGFHGMAAGFADLEIAIRRRSRNECIQAMARLCRDYQIVKENLRIILEIERKIVSHSAGGS